MPPIMTSTQKADNENAILSCRSTVKNEAESSQTRAHVTTEKVNGARFSAGNDSPMQASIIACAQETPALGRAAKNIHSIISYTSGTVSNILL